MLKEYFRHLKKKNKLCCQLQIISASLLVQKKVTEVKKLHFSQCKINRKIVQKTFS